MKHSEPQASIEGLLSKAYDLVADMQAVCTKLECSFVKCREPEQAMGLLFRYGKAFNALEEIAEALEGRDIGWHKDIRPEIQATPRPKQKNTQRNHRKLRTNPFSGGREIKEKKIEKKHTSLQLSNERIFHYA